MRNKFLSLAALAAFCCGAPAFDPRPEPVAPDGTKAVVDLPTSQHMRNVGGSDGAGLCVFTSIQHSAYWQNVRALDGFRQWMQRRPGGGWPEKVDKMFAQFCKEKGVAVPAYIQHTGGDPVFLELALRTGRCPGVTYNGRDDFYRSTIAHMVSLAHLDKTHAAIIDNNRPGVWLWMTREEFLSRWKGGGGGWAVVLLDPPPTPHPDAPKFFGGCACGGECECKPGACPAKCPTVFGQCPGGRCGTGGRGPVGPLASPFAPAPAFAPFVPAPVAPAIPAAPVAPAAGPEPIGNPPTERHEWGQFAGGGWGWRLKADPPAAEAAPLENFGIDLAKIHGGKAYSLNGQEVTREEALSVFGDGLKDDSDRWNVAAVGDAGFLALVKADVAALPADARGKVHVQLYAPDRWEVAALSLAPGVTLRKPAGTSRVAATVGTVAAGEYGAGKLAELLALDGGPTWKPKPKPEPKPVDPVKPAPDDKAKPAPVDPANPAPSGPTLPDKDSCGWCAAVAALLAWALREAMKKQ
jgi:hypothetical protein